MTQQTVIAPTSVQESTCEGCEKFINYHDRGRGECLVSGNVVRKHHIQTNDCKLNLPTEEDLPHAEYQPGQIVQVIDEGEKDTKEWAKFIVIGANYNQARFRSTQAYLSEPDWYYLVASPDYTQHQFSVAENEICHVEQSYIIDTSEVF